MHEKNQLFKISDRPPPPPPRSRLCKCGPRVTRLASAVEFLGQGLEWLAGRGDAFWKLVSLEQKTRALLGLWIFHRLLGAGGGGV